MIKRLHRASRNVYVLALFPLPIGGCATAPARTPYTLADLAAAKPLGGSPVRMWARGDDARYDQITAEILTQRQAAGLPAPSSLLAISGGSDKGAFSAGLLNAWTRRGDRPQFDMVTGVSTGALIAPFAFLGRDEDQTLTLIYTNISQKDIFRKRGIAGAIGKAGAVDTSPLRDLIARYVTPAFLDRIAVEHRRGRRLFVVTTNLDAQQGVVWDMGAIASSTFPDRVGLFARVLLASASIPGIFSPVLIDVTSNGRRFKEMHVDGGAVGGFFTLPRAILTGKAKTRVSPNPRIYVLYNGKLRPKFNVVNTRIFSVVSGALTTLLGEIDRNSVDELQAFVNAAKGYIKVCSIEQDYSAEKMPVFDKEHMRSLYKMGEREATIVKSCLR